MRRRTKSIAESQFDTYDNLCLIEDDLMNRLKKYLKNREYDESYEKLVNHIKNIADSKIGLYKNCIIIEEVREFRKLFTSIPPEILEQYIPHHQPINPDVIIPSAYA